MAQVRIMGDDPERVRQVAELLLPLIQDSPDLQHGDPSEVPNRRGPGLRIFVEVTPTAPPSERIYVPSERADVVPSKPLPPGSS